MANGKKWYAVYTKPRWEKKVNSLLQEKGFESYCPLNKVRRKWSDRIKLVEEPLFKSYVFVKVSEDERTPVRMIPGVMNFVYWQGKPAVIREKEIANIKKFLDEYENVKVFSGEQWKAGSRVKVLGGPFMDMEGRVLAMKGKTVKVMIESLDYMLVAVIERRKLAATPSN
jgi:transcription antitermination factor NusG